MIGQAFSSVCQIAQVACFIAITKNFQHVRLPVATPVAKISGMATTNAHRAKGLNWVRIEAEYRSGIYSDRQIGGKHGISHTAVQKRAKKEGWTRDLAPRIALKRDQKLAQQAAHEKAASTTGEAMSEAVADVQVFIINKHRKASDRFQRVLGKMLKELEFTGDHIAELKDALPKLAEENNSVDKTAIRKAFNDLASLPTRTTSIHKLTTSLAALVDIERRSHGIEDKQKSEEKSYEERLKELANGSP